MPAMRYTMTGMLGLALTIPLTWGWYLFTMAFIPTPQQDKCPIEQMFLAPTAACGQQNIYTCNLKRKKNDEPFVQVKFFLLWKVYNRNLMTNIFADLVWLPQKIRNCHIKQLYQHLRYHRLLCWQPLLPAVTTTLSIWQLSVFSEICYRQLHVFAANKCISRVNIKDKKLSHKNYHTIHHPLTFAAHFCCLNKILDKCTANETICDIHHSNEQKLFHYW